MDGIIQIKISKMTTISKWMEYFGNIAMRRPRKAKKRSTTLICSIITVRISSIISYFAER
jgi:hypothetical protein